ELEAIEIFRPVDRPCRACSGLLLAEVVAPGGCRHVLHSPLPVGDPIRQADVFGAYLAYADHEIGRVIQAVEDLGQLDNTLIIYISGDNGASAEGMLNGTPNEFTTFNGVPVPVKDQLLWYPFWGSERNFPHFSSPYTSS